MASVVPVEMVIVPVTFGIPAVVILAFRWFRHREHMATLAASPDNARGIEERLARVEQAVDAIAVEVERVGEGQRFVTKLLAERAPQRVEAPAPPPGRVNTPH